MTPDAAAWFAAQYGREPEGAWFAPGRVNMLGGPDYAEVFVLPFALGAGVTVAAGRRPDRRIRLTSRQMPGEPVILDIDALEPGRVRGWAAYPAGVGWALRQADHLAGGADLAVDADLPAGAGLSSSAALECATALALTELYQVEVPRLELAALAHRAENQFAGVPSGIMDQIVALLGRAGHALLLDCRSGIAAPVPLDPAAVGLALIVIDTRVRRALADGRYAQRRAACEQAASALGVRSLRDITDGEKLARLTDPALLRISKHVVAETRRVLNAADLLRASDRAGVRASDRASDRAGVRASDRAGVRASDRATDPTAIGPLLTTSHRSLRDRFEVSWPQADQAVDAALAAGAAGARMTGGGFGGCVVALVPAERATQIRRAVADRFTQHHWPAPHYLDAVPSAAARRVRS
jgi:galactokinase